MKQTIYWREPTELQVVVDVVNGEQIFSKQTRRAWVGENVTILDDRDDFLDIQFENGDIVYHIDKNLVSYCCPKSIYL